MAATSTQSVLAEEIREQVAAALSLTTDARIFIRYPHQEAIWADESAIIEFGVVTLGERADNEADFVSYEVAVTLVATSDDSEINGQRLDDLGRLVVKALGDRASDRSPLMTDPLPISGLAFPANVAPFSIRMLTTEQGVIGEDGGFRNSMRIPLEVRTYERST